MSPDQLTTYVAAAAMVGGCIGFFACALFAAKLLRETYEEAYEAGYLAGISDADEPDAADDLGDIKWRVYPGESKTIQPTS